MIVAGHGKVDAHTHGAHARAQPHLAESGRARRTHRPVEISERERHLHGHVRGAQRVAVVDRSAWQVIVEHVRIDG